MTDGPDDHDRPASARRLVGGAAWTYGGQLVAVIAQFGYAAVTSRLVGPHEFGIYAITLAITALVTLLATGGLGQTVGRMQELDRTTVRALCTLSIVLGVVSAALLAGLAPLWAALWSTPSAAPAVSVMAFGALTAPLYGLVTGLVRRIGRFRALAAQQLIGALGGMVLGVVAVVIGRNAETLLVSPIAAQLITTALAAWSARRYLGFGALRDGVGELSFSARLTVASVLSYGVGNITRIAATNAIGPAALGYWNRAEVVSLIPFQQVQNALIQTVYPEFRHDSGSPDRARRVWTDLLIVVGWGVGLVAAAGAIAVPPLVLLLLGPQWEVARTLVPILMFAGAVQAVGTILASAVEAIGRFGWVWSTQVALLVLQGILAAAIISTHSLLIAVLGLLVTGVVRQIWQSVLCSRAGYLEGRRYLRHAVAVTVVCGGAYAAAAGLLALAGYTLLNTAVLLVIVLGVAVLLRRRLLRSSLFLLLGRYGLLRRRGSKDPRSA